MNREQFERRWRERKHEPFTEQDAEKLEHLLKQEVMLKALVQVMNEAEERARHLRTISMADLEKAQGRLDGYDLFLHRLLELTESEDNG